jgi:hypothetical protein
VTREKSGVTLKKGYRDCPQAFRGTSFTDNPQRPSQITSTVSRTADIVLQSFEWLQLAFRPALQLHDPFVTRRPVFQMWKAIINVCGVSALCRVVNYEVRRLFG